MFEDPEFVAWANENVVFLVGYRGKNHAGEAKEEPKDGGDEKPDGDASDKPAGKPAKKGKNAVVECPLYPGITCDEHETIMEDAKEGKGGPKLEVNGFPTSYMIAPDGSFEQHKKDRKTKELEDGVAEWTKKKSLKPSKKYATYLQAFADGDKATSDGKWKVAVAAYQKVDAVAKRLHGLAGSLSTRLEALNDAVEEAFEKARDDAAADDAARYASVKSLRDAVAPKFQNGTLPVVADLDAWLKEHPAPPPAAKAK